MSEGSARRRQRIGAYAVIQRDRDGTQQILMTRMSARTPIEGRWTLPGGGIEHGEDPWEAVVREVHEETGLRVTPTRLLTVTSGHRVGPGHDGAIEDYHGIHLVFEGELDPADVDITPHVVEEDSSTDVSAWLDVEEARRRPLLRAAATVLGVPFEG